MNKSQVSNVTSVTLLQFIGAIALLAALKFGMSAFTQSQLEQLKQDVEASSGAASKIMESSKAEWTSSNWPKPESFSNFSKQVNDSPVPWQTGN